MLSICSEKQKTLSQKIAVMCMAGLCEHAADTCLLELVRIDKKYAKEPDKV
jgi:hypothetical protein